MSEAAPRRWGFLPLLRWGEFGRRWRPEPLVAAGLAMFLALAAFAWLGPLFYTASPYAIHALPDWYKSYFLSFYNIFSFIIECYNL